MDNASKALIMAGGILIAVLVISVSLYVITSARGVAKASNERVEANAVQSFNRFYSTYTSDGSAVSVKGIDAINIYRKALDDSKRESGALHTIEIADGDVDASIIKISNALDTGTGDGTGAEVYAQDYYFSYTTDFDGYVWKIKLSKK